MVTLVALDEARRADERLHVCAWITTLGTGQHSVAVALFTASRGPLNIFSFFYCDTAWDFVPT